MTLRQDLSTRNVSVVMLAAFAGVALWLFAPWGGAQGGQLAFGGATKASAVQVDGAVKVETQGDVVTRLVVPLALRGSQSITLTDDSGKMRAETFLSETAAAAVPATYTVEWVFGDGDNMLEKGEQALLIVGLPERSTIHPGNPLRLVIRPLSGDSLVIYDVLGD